MSSLTETAVMPELEPGQMTMVLQPNNYWLVRIGRARRTKSVYLSPAEAAQLQQLMGKNLPKVTVTAAKPDAPKVTPARTRARSAGKTPASS